MSSATSLRLTLNVEAYEYTAMADDVPGLLFMTDVDDSRPNLAVIRPEYSIHLEPGYESWIVADECDDDDGGIRGDDDYRPGVGDMKIYPVNVC